jgi:hypothetical protein
MMCVILAACGGWALPAQAAQTIQPAKDGTLADGGVFGPFDGAPDSVDWTFNQSSYEGAVTLTTANPSSSLEHRVVWEYNLSGVSASPPVSATLTFTLRGAPVFPLPDTPVQIVAYPADLQESLADFAAGPAAPQGTVTVKAFQAPTVYTLNVSDAVNQALAGSRKVAFRFQVDSGAAQDAGQAFIDARDSVPASKPFLTVGGASLPLITAWKSVIQHGSAGALAIPLVEGADTTEPRLASGQQTIRVDITSAGGTPTVAGAVQAVDQNTGAAVNASAATVADLGGGLYAVDLVFAPPLASAAGSPSVQGCYRIDLGPNITGLTGDTDMTFKMVTGDVSGDGQTLLNDLALVKLRAQAGPSTIDPASIDDIRRDISCDGSVLLNDVALAKMNNGNGQVLTCP